MNEPLAGDVRELEELLAAVRDDVYRLALRMLWHPDDAEDATQEILVKVATRIDSYRGEAAVRTWVYRIAVNHLLDRKRSRLERARLDFATFADDLVEGLEDPRPDLAPDADVLAEEVKLGCTLAMLSCLDRDHRVAWILGEVFDLPGDDAAWICDVSSATYRKRLSRARTRLRAFVEANCGLVDQANRCRCHQRVNAAVASGRVDPDRLLFASPPADRRLRRATDEMEALHTAASLLRDHPDYRAPQAVTERIAAMLRQRDLEILDASTNRPRP